MWFYTHFSTNFWEWGRHIRTIFSTQLGAQRTLETTKEVQQVENRKLLQVVILHGALRGEREHESIYTQLVLTILVKQDELLVRLNVRSIRSRAGTTVQVHVPWMTANRIFTSLVCIQAITWTSWTVVYHTLHSTILIFSTKLGTYTRFKFRMARCVLKTIKNIFLVH